MSIRHWESSREISRRIVITGELELITPARFGNGDAEGTTDMSLLLDPLKGVALLTGASVTGALRSYLWELEQGYGVSYDTQRPRQRKALAVRLFGGALGDPEGLQSPLIVDDALGGAPQVELRDGVQINPETRTAAEKKKFDLELLQAGTRFGLRFELLAAKADEADLREALALALTGLESGEIHLGARKQRGFGECRVSRWEVCEYDLLAAKGAGLVGWLSDDPSGSKSGAQIAGLLGVSAAVKSFVDRRERLRLRAEFWLDGSLLIRSGFGEADSGPDVTHLHRHKLGTERSMPVLPGTSLAGVLRHRALRIAQTLHPDVGAQMVDDLFGRGPEDGADTDRHTGSRVEVRETEIGSKGVRSLVQNRIRVDRFTGGVLDNFLFDEAPIFGGPASRVVVDVTVRNPSPAEVGLLLLVLKDLWTSDLLVGGGANVGRGRLHGVRAEIALRTLHDAEAADRTWVLEQAWQGRRPEALRVTQGQSAELQEFVAALNRRGTQ